MSFHVVRIAHRGASVECPENTLLAYRKAIDYGIDALEADIHLTRDRELVAIHDGKLDRTTNGTGPVREHTLSELAALDAGRGEKIRRLEKARTPKDANNAWYEVVLRQGKNRQIRKMFERIGHSVMRLRRVSIGTVKLGTLFLSTSLTCRLLSINGHRYGVMALKRCL